MNLNFDNNWRRTFLLTRQTDKNIDKPVQYVILDNNTLPCNFKKFCEQFAYDYNFDYDTFSKVIWASNDNISSSSLVDSINRDFPKLASITVKKPSVIHNLSFNESEDE